MGFLSRKDVVSTPPRFAVRVVDVQDWGGGGQVLVQGGGGDERDDFDTSIMTGKGKNRDVNLKRLRAKLVSMACVEPPEGFELPADGKCERLPKFFTEADIEVLAKQSGRDLQAVFEVAQELWGLKPEDVEELAGESPAARSGSSGTGLPANGAVLALSSNAS